MIHDVELVPSIRPFEPTPQFTRVKKPSGLAYYTNPNVRTSNFNCYVCEDEDHRLYFVPALKTFEREVLELRNQFHRYRNIYRINYNHYQQMLNDQQFRIRPIIDMTNREIKANAVTDGLWQTACGLTAAQVAESSSWDIGTQMGFPVGLAIVGAALRGFHFCSEYQRKHGVPPPPRIQKEIIKECAAFGVKSAISMGAWELGFFVGQCIVTACSTTPFTLWVPVALSICSGFMQGVFAVMTAIADEKRKFGEIRSSTFELAKTFMTSFVSGAAWQICSFIPFGSVLAKTILKPAAEILSTVLTGAVTAIVSYCISKLVPKILDSSAYILSLISPEKKPKFRMIAEQAKKDDKKPAEQTTPKVSQDRVYENPKATFNMKKTGG